MNVLKCPFCGSDVQIQELIDVDYELENGRKAFRLCCDNLYCIMYNGTFNYYPTEEMAIKCWNERIKECRY